MPYKKKQEFVGFLKNLLGEKEKNNIGVSSTTLCTQNFKCLFEYKIR